MRDAQRSKSPWIHFPRAVVALVGLALFHMLSGDPLASWPMIAVGVFALLARITRSIEKRFVRIELSIVGSACALIFLQGGNVVLYNNPSLAIVLCTLGLLAGLNSINVSIPQLRFVAAPVLLIAFFGALRILEPRFQSSYENVLLSTLLLAIAWELLSALIFAKRNAPSLTETGSALALAFIYYHYTADFTIAAGLAIALLLAYFLGASERVESQRFEGVAQGALKTRGLRGPRRAHATVTLLGLLLFALFTWLLLDKSYFESFTESTRLAARPLEIPERDRIEQAFSLVPRNERNRFRPPTSTEINALESAASDARIRRQADSDKRKVIIRTHNPDSERRRGLNVEPSSQEIAEIVKTQSAPPAISITAPDARSLLPNYTTNTDLPEPAESDRDSSSAIPIDFELGGISEHQENEPSDSGDSIEDRTVGESLRVSYSPPADDDAITPPTPSLSQKERQQRSTSIARSIQSSVSIARSTRALEFADKVSIRLNTRPIIEVYVPSDVKAPRQLYLRFDALETLSHDRFTSTASDSKDLIQLDNPGWNQAPGSFRSNQDATEPWTIALGSSWKNEIPVLGRFHSIQIPQGASLVADERRFTLSRQSSSGPFAYRFSGLELEDARPVANASLSADTLQSLTELTLNNRDITYLKRLSTRIAGRNATPETFARRAGIYFSNTHPYSFDFEFNSKDEENLLVSWLRSRSPGICGYYAGAFTLLARSRGIPARVVVGALTREYNARERTFIARDRDAHAWAEYLDANNRWVRVDLTPFTRKTPRFTQGETQADSFDTQIQTALLTLPEDPTTEASEENVSTLARSTPPENPASDEGASGIIPSALSIIDRILANDANANADNVPGIEETKAPPAAAPPPESTTTGPAQTPTRGPIMADHSATALEPTELPSIPTTSSIVRDESDSSSILTPRVLVNYGFVALLLAFLLSQIGRLAFLFFRRSDVISNSREVDTLRSLAGRLLHDIETLTVPAEANDDRLAALRRQAIDCRYGPSCELNAIKRLKREVAQFASGN